MSGAVRSVAVRLSAEVAGYIRDMKAAGTATDQIGSHAQRSRRHLGSMFTMMSTGVAALGLGKLAKDSVALEASYSKTMNVVRATTKASAKEMAGLDRLAMKMGADTVFSANDASRAILELSRGGITPAAIQAGALQGTLTLAAAGELEMGEAANIAVKSMGQFNLKGKDASAVAAALAGGANASSASVQDMAYALAQGGLAANSVGFSLQETTGILAAFSNNGLEGSDAGTSLKTALDRLQPTTTAAEAAMRGLGIITEDGTNRFIKANGEFESAARIAGVLKEGTKDLSDAEAKRLITQAFGSDAQRAATILAKEGASGIREMTKATSDQAAADKMAKANMEGTAGALERMHGAIETAELALGKALAPTVADVAETISEDLLPPVTHFIDQMRTGRGAGGRFADSLGNVRDVVSDVAGVVGDAVDAFTKLPDWAQKAVILGGVTAVAAGKLKGVTGGRAGGLLGGSRGGLLGGVVSRGTPVPVFVTNPGFGGPGGDGLPGGKTGGAGRTAGKLGVIAGTATAAGGVLAVDTILGGVATVGLMNFEKTVMPDSFKDGVAGSPISSSVAGAGGGMTLGDHPFDFSDTDQKGWQSNVGSWLSSSVDQLAAAGRAATTFRKEITDLPKAIQTQIKTPGLLTSVAAVKVLKDQYRLTPRQVLTTLKASGVVKTMKDVREAQRTFHLTPKQVVTLIRTTGVRPSLADVAKMQKEYKLTGKPVMTLLKATGVDFSLGQALKLQRQYKLTGQDVITLLKARDLASGTIGHVRGLLDGLNGKTATTFIRTVHTNNTIGEFSGTGARTPKGKGQATGGPIVGPGTGTSDDVPIWASNGEHMLTAAEVQAMGGHRRVERLRYLARSGQLPAYAGGGEIRPGGASRRFAAVGTGPSYGGRGGQVLQVRGTLDTPWGPAEVVGIVDDRIAAHKTYPTGRRHRG